MLDPKNLKHTPHPSHKMNDWESTVVTILATPRFGALRSCVQCDGEHAVSVCGEAMHEILERQCPFADKKEG